MLFGLTAAGAGRRRCCLARYWLVTSKFGRVLTAIRDAESRVMFIGYNPLWLQAVHLDRCRPCSAASPARSTCRRSASSTRAKCRPANSIEIAIWVAVGGRGTLIGPVIGAVHRQSAPRAGSPSASPNTGCSSSARCSSSSRCMLPQGLVGLLARRSWRSRRSRPHEHHDTASTTPPGRQRRAATQMGHVVTGQLDLSHNVILYLKTSPSASTASRRSTS